MQPADSTRIKMTAAEYADRFGDIAVRLNWKKFADEQWPVERHVISAPEVLAQFHTFFRSSLGRINPHFLHWVGVRQMRVHQVLRRLDEVPAGDRKDIMEIAAQFRQEQEPVRLTLPTFELGNGRRFLLDGNHRACGLALSGRAFRLELYSLAGPVTREALIDLIHCR